MEALECLIADLRRLLVQEVAIGRRAVLQKEGSPDVCVELHRRDPLTYEYVINGKRTGAMWRALTPSSLTSPVNSLFGAEAYSLDDAWQNLLAKQFAGYSANKTEDLMAEIPVG